MNTILVGSDGSSGYSITASTRNITITGISWTLEAKHVGYILNMTQDLLVYAPIDGFPGITVSGGVITYDSSKAALASGDLLHIQLFPPDHGFDSALDAYKAYVLNPEYAHYTSVEHLINESNLGIDGVHDGGDASAGFTDTGETYTAETVAEGYKIYNVTDGSDGTITADTLSGLAGDGGAGNPTADDIEATLANGTDDDWDDDDVASIPECKRFVIPAEGFNHMSIDVLLDSQDANNSCYCKIYATNDENADDTDDIYWKDISTTVFGAAQLEADGIGDAGRAVTHGIYFIDTAYTVLKYMIKIVAENDDGTQDNEFDIRIKKSS